MTTLYRGGKGGPEPNWGEIVSLIRHSPPFINVPGNGHSVRTTKQQRHKRHQLELTTDDFE